MRFFVVNQTVNNYIIVNLKLIATCPRESMLCKPIDFKYSPSEKFLIG